MVPVDGLLADKAVVVTGAARGLGRAFALRLAAAGARVALADREDVTTTLAEVEQAGGQAIGLRCDVTDSAAVVQLASATVAAFGRIDGLVNNAALYGSLKAGPFDSLDEAEWDACMAVNVRGVWNCCRAVVPALRKAGGGSIVNISSLAATYGMANALHYVTSKAAVIGLTRGLARELGRYWIRVNAIAPSAVKTEGTREFFGDNLDHAFEIIRTSQSLRQTLEPNDIADTVVYLTSGLSRFVSGQTVMVDGGTTFL